MKILIFFAISILYSTMFAFSKDLSSDYKQHLQEILPYFEESLARAFRNLGARNKQKIHKIDDVLITTEDDTQIELRNLTFPWVPDFRINELSVNFEMLCLDVNFKLGNLRIEGDYIANNASLQKLLPVSHNGKIIITFNNVTVSGRVGLLIVEDSFVAENYDIKYDSTEVVVRVTYHVDADNEIENEITKSNVEDTLGKTVWVQLNDILTQLLDRQLGEVVVEFSVQELLADQDEQLREHAREKKIKANRFLDSLLCAAKDHIVEQNFRKITTPPFRVIFRGKPTSVKLGKLASSSGFIEDLSTLTRLKDFSLFEDSKALIVYGKITLKDFKYGFDKYTSEFEESKVSGTINSTIYRNKIFMKIVVYKDGTNCTTQLDTAQVRTLEDVSVDSSGLGCLSWLAPKLQSWVIGNLRNNALLALEKYIIESFNHAIKSSDCVGLLID